MRRDDRTGRRRPDRIYAARSDWLCRALLVLHHSDRPAAGREASRFEDLLREVERVAASGFKEIALTGVHLGSYGRDLDAARSLIHLLRSASSAA